MFGAEGKVRAEKGAAEGDLGSSSSVLSSHTS